MINTIELRPWGKFEIISESETEKFVLNWFPEFKELIKTKNIKPKLLFVDEDKKISLQYHNKRSEIWRVLSNQAKIQIDNNISLHEKEEIIYIKQGQLHRLFGPCIIAEIWISEKDNPSDENDIVRIEDEYNRIQLGALNCHSRNATIVRTRRV